MEKGLCGRRRFRKRVCGERRWVGGWRWSGKGFVWEEVGGGSWEKGLCGRRRFGKRVCGGRKLVEVETGRGKGLVVEEVGGGSWERGFVWVEAVEGGRGKGFL